MQITLSRLTLKNFKGARDVTVNFGERTILMGRNETGKTTVFDGFLWLLFDKDSTNKKDFDIKTLDRHNHVIQGLDHEVEGRLVVDGRTVTLRKVYAEKWTKKRGSAVQEFTGHTTDYFIDGVPTKQKDYKSYIDSLIDEGVFKLLTSPTYFNEQLSWQDRRKTLLEVCGGASDDEVIASNEALSGLPAILNGRNIEDHRKVIAARRADINKELDKIPVRIDEANRSKPNTNDLNETALQGEIDQLKFEVEAKESELSRLQTGGEVAVQENRIREIEGDLLAIKNRVQSDSLDRLSKQRALVSGLQNQHSKISDEIDKITGQIETKTTSITDKEAETKRLRVEWESINAETYITPVIADAEVSDDTCAACRRPLPAEQVQAARDKALSAWNRSKSQRLESVATNGKKAKSDGDRLANEKAQLVEKSEQLLHELSSIEEPKESAEHELERLETAAEEYTSDPEYVVKQSEIGAVKDKIIGLRQSVADDVQRVRTELMDLRDGLRRKEISFASFAQVRNTDARIEELAQQERTLAAEYERLEHELYLTEEFIRCKVSLLEERINSQFQQARFKLFEEQVNGGLQETCQTLYKGVPYGTGLNAGGRILVGVDIVRTLQQHYGISAPVWVDNRESVTDPLDADCQLIELVADKSVDKLRVETSDEFQEAV